MCDNPSLALRSQTPAGHLHFLAVLVRSEVTAHPEAYNNAFLGYITKPPRRLLCVG